MHRLLVLLAVLLVPASALAAECASGFDRTGRQIILRGKYKAQPRGDCPKGCKLACEGCGSDGAGAVNRARFWIDQAVKSKRAKHPLICARQAYAAAAMIDGLFDYRARHGKSWRKTSIYATRWDGSGLSWKQFFDKARAHKKRAVQLYRKCGGKMPMPKFQGFDLDIHANTANRCMSKQEMRALYSRKNHERARRPARSSEAAPNSEAAPSNEPEPGSDEPKKNDGTAERVSTANNCCQACVDAAGTVNTSNCASSSACSNKYGQELSDCRDACAKTLMECTNSCLQQSNVQLGDATVCYNAQG